MRSADATIDAARGHYGRIVTVGPQVRVYTPDYAAVSDI